MKTLDDYTDEQLLQYKEQLSGTGKDEEIMEYLINKYKYLVRRKANQMFLLGGDKDDLIQEGMIGLFKAVREYDAIKNVEFRYFAELCITRQLYTAVSASQRKKHQPLNTYVSFYDIKNPMAENGEKQILLEDLIASGSSKNPEELWIDKENGLLLEHVIEENLSGFEKKVVESYLDGNTYQEIAERLGKPVKSIDNAMQRIKRKLKQVMAEEEIR